MKITERKEECQDKADDILLVVVEEKKSKTECVCVCVCARTHEREKDSLRKLTDKSEEKQRESVRAC